jgi:hypothetical protein
VDFLGVHWHASGNLELGDFGSFFKLLMMICWQWLKQSEKEEDAGCKFMEIPR